MRLATVLLTLACLHAGSTLQAETHYRFDDNFSDAEQRTLIVWLTEVADAMERLVGPLPLDIHFTLHRTSATEPVPWAHTTRGFRQGIKFYVDPTYSLEELRSDWTAPHELSHLILPYLGSRHAWFAEGFASFMQFQVMQEMGVLTAEQAIQRYASRLQRAKERYRFPEQTLVEAAPRLVAGREYAVMYWGGAAYFLNLDELLQSRHDLDLITLLRRYLACCRNNRSSLERLISQFDAILGAASCRQLLTRFETATGFPAFPQQFDRR